jgi:hypothetical protein
MFRICDLLLQLSINFAETFWLEEYHLQGCHVAWWDSTDISEECQCTSTRLHDFQLGR